MYKICLFFVLPLSLLLLSFDLTKSSTREPITYKFSYISMLMGGEQISKLNWDQPRLLSDKIQFVIVNDSVMYKQDFYNGSIKNTTTLNKSPRSILKLFKELPSHYLDFELIGAFNFKHLPKDIWNVYYYSKKRKALLDVEHEFELNRIGGVILYMNKPNNPFKDYENYFKILVGSERTYNYPVIHLK